MQAHLDKIVGEGLTYDDVLLIPAFSEVRPREVNIQAKFTRNITINVPIVSAAMDTVTESRMAIAMAREGGIGVLHKNMSIDEQALKVRKVKRAESGMIIDPVTLPLTATVKDAKENMREFSIGGIPIVDNDHKLLGIVTNRDLRFEKNNALEGYHPDVEVFEVFNREGDFYALLYTDFFPRTGKRNGAWMTSYRAQKKGQRPHISMVCNFSKPTASAPSLLTFQEVTTLFHEFGHALHGMLANTTYAGLSGTNVFWDFVELPSQIMENWCYEKQALELFARHYQTDEPIPMEFIEKLKKLAHFQQGLQTLRQLGFGFLDLSYHSKGATAIKNVKAHESAILKRVQFTKDHPENSTSTAFSHIFQGGYSAGYYSYKWAEVLDADAFELFLEKGIFDPQTAKSFEENILSKGGTEHPMTLFKRFRGKAPDPKALLKRAGLVENT